MNWRTLQKVQENASFTKRLKLADLSQRPLAPTDNIKPLAEEKKYSMAELNQLNNKQLTDLLVTIKWYQIRNYFSLIVIVLNSIKMIARCKQLLIN